MQLILSASICSEPITTVHSTGLESASHSGQFMVHLAADSTLARWRHSFRRNKQIGNALDSITGRLDRRILLLTHAVLLGLVREQHELPVEE
jgi:hypothetical protein